MISVTVNGVAAWLAIDPPSWGAGVSCSIGVPVDTVRGLTGRETRRPRAEKLRVREYAFQLLLGRAQTTRWRNAWQARQDEPIFVPFWPAVVPAGSFASAPIRGGWSILISSAGELLEIFEGSTPVATPPVDALAAPLLWTRPGRQPAFEQVSPELASVSVSLADDGPVGWALITDEPHLAAGPPLGVRNWPVLPLVPDWQDQIGHGLASIDVTVEELGRRRERVSAAWPQAPRRTVGASAWVDSVAAAEVLGWLMASGGSDPVWAPTWHAEARLAVDANDSDTELELDTAASAFGSNRYLALFQPSGHMVIRAIEDSDGQTITLAEPLPEVPVLWPIGSTLLTTAALCRLRRPEVDLQWAAPGRGRVSLTLVEIPAEYLTLANEVHGETLGALPLEVSLIRLALKYPEATIVHRWTDHESDVTDGEHVWNSRPLELLDDGLRTSLAFDRSSVTLRGRMWPGCPWSAWIQGQEADATLLVERAVVTAGLVGDRQQLFAGRVGTVSWAAPMWEVRVDSVLPWFRPVPPILLQPGCNHRLFKVGCGLVPDDWKCGAVVESVSADGLTLSLSSLARLVTQAPPEDHEGRVPAGWFAGGWARIGVGSSAQHRMIGSNPQGGEVYGTVSITLQLPLSEVPTLPFGINLWPGCDGRPKTCSEKFSNFTRFGGMPHMPTKSPSFQPLKRSTSPSGKK